MKLRTIAESDWGHMALDVAGLAPFIGEPADLANALWYAKKGDYFSAVLSLISLIPEFGDVLGKGVKYLGKSSAFGAEIIAKYGGKIADHWPKVKAFIAKLDDWKPFVRELDAVIAEIRSRFEEQELANVRQAV